MDYSEVVGSSHVFCRLGIFTPWQFPRASPEHQTLSLEFLIVATCLSTPPSPPL